MPVVLGWTAVRGKLEIEALVLFAIMFVWQFPHFLSIAWLYRETMPKAIFECCPWYSPTESPPCGGFWLTPRP